jgi:enoyl-[acyl-carrier protein] reductase I
VTTFQGKKFLIVGVANDKSIAWGISEALHKAGAELAFTYVNEMIEKRVRPLAQSLGCDLVLPCDVQSDSEIDSLAAALGNRWGRVDGIVHSVAFAEREDLQGRFSKTSRSGFKLALDVSTYSLIALCGRFEELLKAGQGSVLTLTYLGSQRVIPNYNVMGVAKAALEASVRYLAADLGNNGVRVNAVSAGPIKTLAASGIPQFKEMLAAFAGKAPLQRNVTLEDVAQTALFLLGPAASGVTGEVLYVDCGFNVMGT